MHWRILVFTILSTTLTYGLNAQTNENKDEGSSYSPLVSELDILAIKRPAFDPMVQHNLNWTRSGHPGSPTRTLPRSLLEARQASPQCTPSNYVLSCPITEASPCCPPGFPVCCHNGICCPENYFCTGLQTCCLTGAVGCGDSCCSSPLVCGTVAGTQTCVDPGSTNVAAPTTASASTTIGASGGGAQTTTGGAGAGSSSVSFANPSYTPADGGQSTTNVAVIGGAVGGGVGALILIALLAWYLLRQKKVNAVAEPGGPETIATPYTNGRPAMVTAFSHDTSPAYPEGHVPPTMNKGNHPWSTNSSGGISGFPYGGSGALGTSYGHSTSSPPPPGSVFGGIATVSDTGSSGVVGPGGYVPPPPEDIPTTTSPGPGGGSHYSGGPTGYGGAAMPPSSAYSPSRHESMSAAGTMYNSNVNPPWVEGVGSPSEQHQPHQPQQRYSQHQPAWSGSGISGPTHDPSSTPWTSGVPSSQPPQPLLPQQQLQMHQPPPPRPWLDSREGPSPGPMTPPPPPFSPGPFGPPPQEGASSGGGRVVPMTAPADHKAKPTKTLSGTGT